VVRPPYPAVVRLCALASTRWAEIDAAYYQINLLRQKPHRFVNLVYAWAIERVPHDKLEQWEMDLVDLLPWQDATSTAAETIESDSFFAMQARGGG